MVPCLLASLLSITVFETGFSGLEGPGVTEPVGLGLVYVGFVVVELGVAGV